MRKVFIALANPLVRRFLKGIYNGWCCAGKNTKGLKIRDYMSDIPEGNYIKIKEKALKSGIIKRVGKTTDCKFEIVFNYIDWSKVL